MADKQQFNTPHNTLEKDTFTLVMFITHCLAYVIFSVIIKDALTYANFIK